MQALVPNFIIDHASRGIHKGSFKAGVTFLDLSGFTALTEKLLKEGNAGAERLSAILNRIFGPLVAQAYQNGAFIPYFAGDAFFAIIPAQEGQKASDLAEATKSLGQELLAFFGKNGRQFDEFTIQAKMGASFGKVNWGIVGKDVKAYYFTGKAMLNAADLQNEVPVGTMGLTSRLKKMFGNHERLNGSKSLGLSEHVDPKYYRHFLPDVLLKQQVTGEFRQVISVFISFKGETNYAKINAVATELLRESAKLGGYFKEIDFSDKGGVMVLFFGAPLAYNDNSARALTFLEQITDQRWWEKEGFEWRAGITGGPAFAGMIGGAERRQYALVGSWVNLAARLMGQAQWGGILTDATIAKSGDFNFSAAGEVLYKGFQDPVETFQFKGRRAGLSLSFQGRYVGRSGPLKETVAHLAQALPRGKGAFVMVAGEPGIGKTRFLYEAFQRVSTGQIWKKLFLQSTPNSSRPFLPFIQGLRQLLQLGDAERNPETGLPQTLPILPASAKLMDDVRRQVESKESILWEILGWGPAKPVKKDETARVRFNRTKSALLALVRYLAAAGKPFWVQVDDVHYLDDGSSGLVRELIPYIDESPLFIAISVREDTNMPLREDWQPVRQSNNPSVFHLVLEELKETEVRNLVKSRLDGPVGKGVMQRLINTSNGNPFFSEQLLELYLDQEIIKKDKSGTYILENGEATISDNLHGVLTARIDQLPNSIKQALKTAAVIGKEFDAAVLRGILETALENEYLQTDEILKTGEDQRLWLKTTKEKYRFRQALMQEAAYHMQLASQVEQLHAQIGHVLESRVNGDVSRYGEIANHYRLAGKNEEALPFILAAADYAEGNYQINRAVYWLDIYQEIVKDRLSTIERIDLLLRRAQLYQQSGKWEKAGDLYFNALDLAEKHSSLPQQAEARLQVGKLLILQGQYSDAERYLAQAHSAFEANGDDRGMVRTLGEIGTLNFRKGDYQKAEGFFEQTLKKDEHINSSKSVVEHQVVASLGLALMNQGHFSKGISFLEDRLKECRKQKDKSGMATLLVNLGIIQYEKGDRDNAQKCYEEGLEISQSMGNTQLSSIAMGCLGAVLQSRGEYQRARDLFEEDLKLTRQLGDLQGIAIASGLLGELVGHMGEFEDAEKHLNRQLTIARKIGYLKGEAKALNTLGDIEFLQSHFDASVNYYNQAIDIAKSIGNPLVVSNSLLEKGIVLLKAQRSGELQEVLDELAPHLVHLQQQNLIIGNLVLRIGLARLCGDQDTAYALIDELSRLDIGKEGAARLVFEQFMLDQTEEKRQKALTAFKDIYAEMPRIAYKLRIEILENAKGQPA